MRLTPARLESVYRMLLNWPPFCKRKMPAKMKFRVSKSTQMYGSYEVQCGAHEIAISSAMCKTMVSVVDTMAHEMVHAALERSGCSDHGNHDSEFGALAAEVCNTLGFNFKEF